MITTARTFTCSALVGLFLSALRMAVAQDSPSTEASAYKPPECLSHYDPSKKYGPPTPGPTGSAEGTITWQYNDFVGTKADTGAIVLLFPAGQQIDAVDVKLLAAAPLSSANCDYKYHLHTATVDGYGKVNFDSLPVGEYHGVIYSAQTSRDMRDPLDPSEVHFYQFLVNGPITGDDLLTFPSRVKLFKTSLIFDLNVQASSTAHFSHDFGHTAR